MRFCCVTSRGLCGGASKKDNTGVEIIEERQHGGGDHGRWLMKEHEPEKMPSSLVIRMKSAEEIGKLRSVRGSSVRQDVTGRDKDKGITPTESPAPSVSSSSCIEPCGLCTGADKGCSLCRESCEAWATCVNRGAVFRQFMFYQGESGESVHFVT